MTKNELYARSLTISVVLISILSVVRYIELATGLPVSNTAIWWSFQTFFLLLLFSCKKHFVSKDQSKLMIMIHVYLIWNIICITRGMFIAETYWDWKGLISNGFALLLPSVVYIATNPTIVKHIFSSYITYALPLFLVFVFITATSSYGMYLIPISFIMLFLPIITWHRKIFIIMLVTFVVLTDLGARSVVIKFGVPAVLSMIYYFRAFFTVRIYEFSRQFLFCLPLMLFSLAVFSNFNVFNLEQYSNSTFTSVITNSAGDVIEDNLLADTRTFLYKDVLLTADVYDSWVFGRTPARGNISEHFGGLDMNGRGERLGNEVAILNVFTWTGIVGVILYGGIFFHASYLAINKSNNIFSKIIGVFIAFRWAYAWVEDINNFTLNTMVLWMMIGMCYSVQFRNMSDLEFKYWVQSLFSKLTIKY